MTEPTESSLPAPEFDPRSWLTALARGLWLWLPTLCFLGLGGWLLGLFAFDPGAANLAALNPKSDYWEHAGVLRELISHPFAPQNPHLAMGLPSPRYMPLFVAIALVARACSMDAIAAMALTGAVNVAVLLVGIFCFFRVYFQDHRAPLYGLVTMLCSYYLGFNFSNVLQLRMLLEVAAYPSTAAVGFTLVTLAIAVRALRGRWSWLWLVLLLLSATNVMLTHPLTAMMMYSGIGVLALVEPEVTWRRRVLVLVALACSVPLAEAWPYFSVIRTMLGGHDFDESWVAAGAQKLASGETQRKRHRFYQLLPLARTIGFAGIGAYGLAAMLFARRHLFLVFGAALVLAPFVLNTFVKVPLGHRYVLYFIYYMQFALVWMLLKATPGFHEGWWVLFGGKWRKVVAVTVVYGLLGTMLAMNVPDMQRRIERARDRSSKAVTLCREVAEVAGEDTIVLAPPITSWVLPACGTKVVATIHHNPLLADSRARTRRLKKVFSKRATLSEIDDIVEEEEVTHVVVRGRPKGAMRQFLRKRHSDGEPITAGFRIYTL